MAPEAPRIMKEPAVPAKPVVVRKQEGGGGGGRGGRGAPSKGGGRLKVWTNIPLSPSPVFPPAKQAFSLVAF